MLLCLTKQFLNCTVVCILMGFCHRSFLHFLITGLLKKFCRSTSEISMCLSNSFFLARRTASKFARFDLKHASVILACFEAFFSSLKLWFSAVNKWRLESDWSFAFAWEFLIYVLEWMCHWFHPEAMEWPNITGYSSRRQKAWDDNRKRMEKNGKNIKNKKSPKPRGHLL